MSDIDQPCCAHLTVSRRSEDYPATEDQAAESRAAQRPDSPYPPLCAGTLLTREWWECDYGCGAQFVRVIQGSTAPSTTRFRKRPVVVEAMQWNGRRELPDPFNVGAIRYCEEGFVHDPRPYLSIKTLDSVAYAFPGDWIVRGTAGEFYPCRSDVFAETYEPASSLETPETTNG